MAITLYNLFEASLLVINAIAILHEERFLNRFGWGKKQNTASMAYNQAFGGPQEGETKQKLWELFHSIRTLARVPLIFVNSLVIVFKLIAG